MPPKKRGRPAKKHAQPTASSELPATPSTLGSTQPTSSEAATTTGLANKRGRLPTETKNPSIASPPRKRGRPRKQLGLFGGSASTTRPPPIKATKKLGESSEPEPALTRESKVIGDSQEDDDIMNYDQPSDDFKPLLKDAMNEVFVRHAIQQDGGLWIPRETALQMQKAFAPMAPVPKGDVFVSPELVISIRENLH